MLPEKSQPVNSDNMKIEKPDSTESNNEPKAEPRKSVPAPVPAIKVPVPEKVDEDTKRPEIKKRIKADVGKSSIADRLSMIELNGQNWMKNNKQVSSMFYTII